MEEVIKKKCSRCQNEKTLDQFHKRTDRKSGFRSECITCGSNRHKKYYHDNSEKIKNDSKNFRIDNPDIVKANNVQFKINNPDYFKKYHIDNKEKRISYSVEYTRNRRLIDPIFRFTNNVRSLIYTSFKQQYTKKAKKTIEILGCTFEQFKVHLESKFTPEMNWDNQGSYWELDHITPISWAKTEQEVYALNHYTNFQPLTCVDNMAKGNRYAG